jgi:hypothetical protein
VLDSLRALAAGLAAWSAIGRLLPTLLRVLALVVPVGTGLLAGLALLLLLAVLGLIRGVVALLVVAGVLLLLLVRLLVLLRLVAWVGHEKLLLNAMPVCTATPVSASGRPGPVGPGSLGL